MFTDVWGLEPGDIHKQGNHYEVETGEAEVWADRPKNQTFTEFLNAQAEYWEEENKLIAMKAQEKKFEEHWLATENSKRICAYYNKKNNIDYYTTEDFVESARKNLGNNNEDSDDGSSFSLLNELEIDVSLTDLGFAGADIEFEILKLYSGYNTQSSQYFEAAKKGYLLKNEDGILSKVGKGLYKNTPTATKFGLKVKLFKGIKYFGLTLNGLEGGIALWNFGGALIDGDEKEIMYSSVDLAVTGIGIWGGVPGLAFSIVWSFGGRELFWYVVEEMDSSNYDPCGRFRR